MHQNTDTEEDAKILLPRMFFFCYSYLHSNPHIPPSACRRLFCFSFYRLNVSGVKQNLTRGYNMVTTDPMIFIAPVLKLCCWQKRTDVL